MSANDDKSAQKSQSSRDDADGTDLGLDDLVSFDGDSFLDMEDGDDDLGLDFGIEDNERDAVDSLDFDLEESRAASDPEVPPIPTAEPEDDIVDLDDLIEETDVVELAQIAATDEAGANEPDEETTPDARADDEDTRDTDSQRTSNHDILEEDILDEEESREALLASLLKPTGDRSKDGPAAASTEDHDDSRSTREVETLDDSVLDDVDGLDDMEDSEQYYNPTVDLGNLDFDTLRSGNVPAAAAEDEEADEEMDPGLAAAAMAEARRPGGPAPHERGFTSEMGQQAAANAHVQAVSEADRQFRTLFMFLIAALILSAVALIVTLILFMQSENRDNSQPAPPQTQSSSEAPPGPEAQATGAQVRGSPNTQPSAQTAPTNTAERAAPETGQSDESETNAGTDANVAAAAATAPSQTGQRAEQENEQRAAAARAIEAQQREQQRRNQAAAAARASAQRAQAEAPDEPTVPAEPATPTPEPVVAPAAEPASLNFAGSPSSRVYINGADTGRNTPLMGIERPPGTYTIRFVNEAHGIDQTSQVTVGSGERVVVRVRR